MKRRRLAALALLVPMLTGCVLKPPNDYALPGGTATGSDGYTVTAVFADLNNLVPNSEVQYHNVKVGSVRSVAVENWRARVTLRLLKKVHLPANVTAKVGQKSLLGAEYLEIADPAQPPTGRLSAGDVIPVARTGDFPETEQVLSSVALLLNNGGLPQIKTITTEFETMLHSRTDQAAVRSLIHDLDVFVGGLDAQKQQIVATIGSVDRLASVLAGQRVAVARAIDHIGPGLQVLNRERATLTSALEALGRFGVTGKRVIDEASAGLQANLAGLRPVLENLAAAGDALPTSLKFILTYPWPLDTLDNVFKGDYANIFVTIDFTLAQLAADFLSGPAPNGTNPKANAALEAKDPMSAPLHTAPATASRTQTPTTPVSSAPAPAAPTSTAPATPAPACNLVQQLLGGC